MFTFKLHNVGLQMKEKVITAHCPKKTRGMKICRMYSFRHFFLPQIFENGQLEINFKIP